MKREKESLRALIVPPSIWAAHFLACYGWAAAACEKAGHAGKPALAAMTLLALAALAVTGAGGCRGRERFLGRSALWLSALSAVAVAFSGGAALLYGSCE